VRELLAEFRAAWPPGQFPVAEAASSQRADIIRTERSAQGLGVRLFYMEEVVTIEAAAACRLAADGFVFSCSRPVYPGQHKRELGCSNTMLTVILFVIVFACAAVPGSTPIAEPSKSIWMIGQVVTNSAGRFEDGQSTADFFSTGFLFKTRSSVYFVTTAHTLDGISAKYGDSHPFFVFLPNVPKGVRNAYPASLLFSERSEDAAVLRPGKLEIQGDYETPYESPRFLARGTELYFLGYPESSPPSKPPHFVRNTLLACGVVRNGLSCPGCEGIVASDTWELYSGREQASAGFSGSPVFRGSTAVLIGILKAVGDDTKDPRVAARIGAKRFNVVRALDRTVARIHALERE